MTIDDVINWLANDNREWTQLYHGGIRDADGRCPLCAMAQDLKPGRGLTRTDWFGACQLLQLDFNEGRKIADAADLRYGIDDLVRRIARACKLKTIFFSEWLTT